MKKAIFDGEKIVYEEMTVDEMVAVQADALRPQLSEISYDEKLSMLLDSIPVEKPAEGDELPINAGYIWKPVFDGTKFTWESVPDPDGIGTVNNPIYWNEGGNVPIINNAYYIKDNALQRYINGFWVGT